MEDNNTCVYMHVKKESREAFYIGIGSIKRPYIKSGRTKWWNNTVSKYGYDTIILKENLSWSDACKIEIDLIKYFGRKDLCEGALVNMTNGGEGTNGIIFSAETRAKMSKVRAGKSFHTKESLKRQLESFRANTKNIERLRKMNEARNRDNNPCVKYSLICLNDNNVFSSIREAGRYYNIDNSYISKHLKGVFDQVKGLRFQRADLNKFL